MKLKKNTIDLNYVILKKKKIHDNSDTSKKFPLMIILIQRLIF